MTNEHNFPPEASTEALQVGAAAFENGNYSEALQIYLNLTNSSAGRAVYLRIGWMYEFGMGTEKNLEKTEYWYNRAVEAGIPEAHYRLGSMYLRAGRMDQVERYMKRAAADGYAPALYHLGQMYRFGKGVEVDEEKAQQYYERAAAQGHLLARRVLADPLIRGKRGVLRIPLGLLIVGKIMFDAFRLYMTNPSDPRIKRPATVFK